MVTTEIGSKTMLSTGRIKEKVMVSTILAITKAIQLLKEIVGKNQARMAKTMIDLIKGRNIRD